MNSASKGLSFRKLWRRSKPLFSVCTLSRMAVFKAYLKGIVAIRVDYGPTKLYEGSSRPMICWHIQENIVRDVGKFIADGCFERGVM